MGSPEVVYVKQYELPNTAEHVMKYELCEICEHIVPDQVIAAQLFKGVWSIWLRTSEAKDHLMSLQTLTVKQHKAEIHGVYPTSKSFPDEKIIFRDLPIDASDDYILDYLDAQSGIKVKSTVIHAKLRDSRNNLTRYYSGERFVYVKGNFSPALNPIAMISNYKCRVWHKSQADACERCRGLDHNTSDISSCKAFSENPDVITIKSSKFVLSNYYPCHVRMYNTSFRSSEHAYQWRFLKHIGMDELAQDVLQAPSAAAAKEIAARIPNSMHKDWHTIRTNAMRDVLHAKADSNHLFKTTLLDSAGYTIIESVRGNIFWSSGLSPSIAASTKSEYFPGANQLGSVMTLVRDQLMKEAILSTKCGLDTVDPKTPPPPQQLRDVDVTSCDSASVVNHHRMSE